MFCDLVGSTALSARLDPEDMRQVIRAYQDACSGVLARYDGFVAKFFGDGILASFGFPRAHEDDAARAVHAGARHRRGRLPACKPARAKSSPSRIGIATGLVVVGDIVGRARRRSRPSSATRPISPRGCKASPSRAASSSRRATRRLIGDRFRLKDLGRHAVKGLAEPVEAYAALGVSAEREPVRGARMPRG